MALLECGGRGSGPARVSTTASWGWNEGKALPGHDGAAPYPNTPPRWPFPGWPFPPPGGGGGDVVARIGKKLQKFAGGNAENATKMRYKMSFCQNGVGLLKPLCLSRRMVMC